MRLSFTTRRSMPICFGFALLALRPGGRLIAVEPRGEPSAERVRGWRMRATPAFWSRKCLPAGRPDARREAARHRRHARADSERGAARYGAGANSRGATSICSIRQTPNKPAWALKPGETVEWHALALADGGDPLLLAFSSLPNAVAFMQPAVVAGTIKDVNKVAKFSRAVAQDWRLLVNPPLEALDGREFVLRPGRSGARRSPRRMSITLADLDFLTSDAGARLLDRLAGEDLSDERTLPLLTALRREFTGAQAGAALELARLRKKAVAKFGDDAATHVLHPRRARTSQRSS